MLILDFVKFSDTISKQGRLFAGIVEMFLKDEYISNNEKKGLTLSVGANRTIFC